MQKDRCLLTAQAVAELRRLRREERLSRAALADRFGIHLGTIDNVLQGRNGHRKAKRCKECGHIVDLPCRACATRAGDTGRRFKGGKNATLDLDLTEGQLQRALEVRLNSLRDSLDDVAEEPNTEAEWLEDEDVEAFPE